MKKLFLLISLITISAFSALAQNAELVIQSGHNNAIRSISFSPDSRFMISSDGKNIIISEAVTGKIVRYLTTNGSQVGNAVYSPDGKSVAAVVMDNKFITAIKLWDTETGKEIRTFSSVSLFMDCLAFSPDGKTLYSGSWDSKMRKWDVEKGEEIGVVVAHVGVVTSVAVSPDGKNVFTGGYDGKVKMFDVATMTEKKIFEGNRVDVTSIVVSKNGKYVVSSGKDSSARVWDISSGKQVQYLKHPEGAVFGVDLSPDCKTIATASMGKKLRLWEFSSGKEITVTGENMFYLYSVAFSPDGKMVAGGEFMNLKLWDSRTGRLIKKFEGHLNMVKTVVMGKECRYMALSGNDGVVKIWDMTTGTIVQTFQCYATMPGGISVSPDGKKVAGFVVNVTPSYTYAYNVGIFDMQTGAYDSIITNHTLPVAGLSFSPDGKFLTTASMDKTVKVFDLSTKKEIKKFDGLEALVGTINYSPDGRYVASADVGNFKLWDINAGKRIDIPMNMEDFFAVTNAVTFSPDGKILAAGCSDNMVRIFETTNFKRTAILKGHSWEVKAVAFSTDGKMLASGGNDQEIRIWDPATGNEMKVLKGHIGYISTLAFTPDGRYLISGSDDGTIKFWDLKSWKDIATYTSMGRESVIWGPDNFYFVSKNGFDLVAFRVGSRTYPFEQFDLKYNRPDIILERMGYSSNELIDAYRNAYLKRLRKLGFSENMLNTDFHLPDVEITNSETMQLFTTDRNVKINCKASDSKYNIDRFLVWVNGVPLYGERGVWVRTNKSGNAIKDFNIPLSTGVNKIQISCLNDKGAESMKKTIEVTYTGKSDKPQIHFIAVSVSNYKDNRWDLNYATKDGRDLAKMYAANKGDYSVTVDTLFDKDVTREKFALLKQKLLKTNPDDQVVLFMSGHGLLDDSLDFYYASYDCDFTKPNTRGISYASIEELLDSIPARQKLLMIDACHSGEVDKEELEVSNSNVALADGKRGGIKTYSYRGVKVNKEKSVGLTNSFELMQDLFTNLNRGSGTVVISASAGKGYALESAEWNNGVFTFALRNGLGWKMADIDKNKIITVSELKMYMIHEVERLTNGAQKPTSRKDNLDVDFKVW